ncbi:MAG TPA: hypothetical protein VGD78_02820 [Chthoniobacterales bacterium]
MGDNDQMDMTSALMSLGIGLVLAALATTPLLISLYLSRPGRSQPGLRSRQVFVTCSAPVPFNYPLLLCRETPGETDAPRPEQDSEEDPADWWKKE